MEPTKTPVERLLDAHSVAREPLRRVWLIDEELALAEARYRELESALGMLPRTGRSKLMLWLERRMRDISRRAESLKEERAELVRRL